MLEGLAAEDIASAALPTKHPTTLDKIRQRSKEELKSAGRNRDSSICYGGGGLVMAHLITLLCSSSVSLFLPLIFPVLVAC